MSKTKNKRKPGRPTRYSHALADRICKGLADGRTLRAVCRDPGMPPESTVREWVVDDRHSFAAHYARARDLGLDAMADELIEVSDDARNDFMAREDPDNPGFNLNGEHVQRSRLRVESRKWYLAKLAPKRYGERQQHEHSGPDGAPIQMRTLDASALSDAALAELMAARDDPDTQP